MYDRRSCSIEVAVNVGVWREIRELDPFHAECLSNLATALFARLVVSQLVTGEEWGVDGWYRVYGGGDPRVRA